jgi:hypothetical protein
MPSELHGELAEAAEREGVSLNQLIVGRLSRSLDATLSAAQPVPPARPTRSRLLTYALAVNLVVLLAAGGIAIALLVVAWRGGF